MSLSFNKSVERISEAYSISINQIVYDKKKAGERVYTFSLGEAFFDIPRFEVDDESFFSGYHYSSSLGQLSLRRKIADLYKRYGACIDPEKEIIISAGSKVIIYMVLKALLNIEDEVLVHEPAWLSYKEQIGLVDAKYIGIPYYVDVNDWEQYISSSTKMIIINNPNNPSGYLYTREELVSIFSLAQKHNLYVLVDEAYSDFLNDNNCFFSMASIDTDKKHSIIVNSLSKNMGMSGWRIGYVISNEFVMRRIKKLNQHLITCAPTVLQDYLANHFEEILAVTLPQAKEMAEKRVEVQRILEELQLNAMKGTGTFYFMIDVSNFPGTTNELVFELLLKRNIATVAGSAYGESTGRFIRFGIGVEQVEVIRECLETIKGYLLLEKYDNTEIREQMKLYGIEEG